MKTAISVPDELFREAEAAAKKEKVSRSQLYSTALTEYLRRRKDAAITAKLNEVCARVDTSLDPALEQAQWEVLGRERW
jgi:metal-responsive CopG/Arc/MetJ family transcriptional regulator